MKYAIDHDFHVHTKLSLCSGDEEMTTGNIAKIAEELGYKKVVITNHVWDSYIEGAPAWYQKQNFDYISSEKPLPSFQGGEMLFGGEIEFALGDVLAMHESRLASFDFMVVPINHLHMKGVTFAGDIANGEECASALTSRLETFSKLRLPWKRVGLAHLTWNFLSPLTIEEILSYCDMQAFEQAFLRIAKQGGGIELNAECFSLKSPSKRELEVYRLAKKCGCKFYLGSDAHHINQFQNSRQKFEYIVDELNLKEEDKFVL